MEPDQERITTASANLLEPLKSKLQRHNANRPRAGIFESVWRLFTGTYTPDRRPQMSDRSDYLQVRAF